MGVSVPAPIGEKFGKLTVIKEVEHTYHPNGKMKRWVEVECDCGEVVVKSLSDVRHGGQKSCGLCKKELKVKDISGMKVYRLTVTNEFRRTSYNCAEWKCVCDCGNIIFVDGRRLRDNRIRNCGECGTPMGSYYWGDKISNFEGYEFTLLKVDGRVATLEDDLGRVFEVGYGFLKRGNFRYPYHRTVAGVGYYGVGPYVAKSGGDRHTEEYENWNSMMKRCYSSSKHMVSYHDKSVCEEWHNFQNFAEWATKQIGFNKGFQLDKDLIVKGNLVYGPDACSYLPREINSFIKRKRLNNLPLGVDIAYNYDGTPYFRSQAREDGKNICLGRFYNVEDAFMAYKAHKESQAKKLAEKWKDQIDKRAYAALMNYTVEITD
jgi:hypothetical protein